MAGYRTDLARARGLGASKTGAGHWIAERVTSIALVPLVLWAVYSALMMSVADYVSAMLWLHSPLNAVLLSLLLAVGFWHMQAGLRVVVEDYVHTPLAKSAVLLLNLFVCAFGGALAIFCVLRVAFSAGGY